MAGKVRLDAGFDTAPFAIDLYLQGDSAGKLRSQVAFSNCPFTHGPAFFEAAVERRDHAITGLVTFGVYEYSKDERAIVPSAAMTPQALQAGQAGIRVAYRNAQEFQALEEEPEAGCDAGKGADEPAAGSLAWRKYEGMPGSAFIAAALVCDGSERNRVKC